MQQKPETQKWNFRISEAEDALGICRSKIYQEIKAGRLKIFKVGRATLISVESLRAWQKLHEGEAA